MPEGDTIWKTSRQLHAAFSGHQFTKSDLRVPAHATADLHDWWMFGVRSRGKHILMDLSPDANDAPELVLHTTLGMEGSWRVFDAGQKWRGGPGWQIRAVMATASHVAVGYRLPHTDLIRVEQESGIVGHLGPDLLGDNWDPALAIQRLVRSGDRPIADALLDQRMLAGIGNVYKSELCFIARLNPWTPVTQVANLGFLLSEAHRLLRINRHTYARVTTGDPRHPMWVYSRGGQPCRVCGTAIRVREQGETSSKRWTWWCPSCQPS